LIEVLDKYEYMFATSDRDLGYRNICQNKIDTGEHQPIHMAPYKQSDEKRKAIAEIIAG